MPWGNCLTAALRKRHQGVVTLIWCFNRSLPHFCVRDYERGLRLDLEADRWDWTIRFLGDESVEPMLLEQLWYRYEDREVPLVEPGWCRGGEQK